MYAASWTRSRCMVYCYSILCRRIPGCSSHGPHWGCIVCVGMPAAGTALAGDDPMYLILNNLKLVGSLTGSRQDTADALSMTARSLLKPMYECFGIEELPQAVEMLSQGGVKGRRVVDFNA
ncbi:hypothetical protein BBP40_006015 [Aspergillus hancockii]|nr:hypothetical protein BBP40_006015 [Aspergillus hancockii]